MAQFTEAFTAANGTNVTSISPWSTGTTGWTSPIVTSNAARGGVQWDYNGAFHNGTYNSNNHFSRGTLVNGSSSISCGVAIRMQSNAKSCFYALLWSGTNDLEIGEMVAGTAISWEDSINVASGSVVEMRIDPVVGTTVYLLDDGVVIKTYTGKNALSGGKPGIFFYSNTTTVTVDDWVGGDTSSIVLPNTRAFYRNLIGL